MDKVAVSKEAFTCASDYVRILAAMEILQGCCVHNPFFRPLINQACDSLDEVATRIGEKIIVGG